MVVACPVLVEGLEVQVYSYFEVEFVYPVEDVEVQVPDYYFVVLGYLQVVVNYFLVVEQR